MRNIDAKLLRQQRDWLLDSAPDCEEADGLVNLLDSILDEIEITSQLTWEKTITSPGSWRWERSDNNATILHERGTRQWVLYTSLGGESGSYSSLAAAQLAAHDEP